MRRNSRIKKQKITPILNFISKYMNITKIKTVIVTILLLGSLQVNAQYHFVTNIDTVTKAHSAFFNLINSYNQDIKIELLKDAIKKRPTFLRYRTFATIQDLYTSTIKTPYFVNIAAIDFSDSMPISISPFKRKIKFIKSNVNKYNKINCFFDLYPIISFGQFFYLKVVCLSKGINKDEMIGEIYLVLNNKMQIIFLDYANKYI